MTAIAARPIAYNKAANLHSALTNRSAGDSTQAMLQALGMDKNQAALFGALRDLQGGNLVGFHQNLTEALTGFESHGGKLGARLRRQHAFRHLGHHHCARSHFVCRPALVRTTRIQRMDLANKVGGLPKALGTLAGFATGGLLGGGIGRLIGKTVARAKARCIEARLRRDPCFRRQFEAKVGGRYIPDGRNDGKITIVRKGFRPYMPGLAPGAFPSLIGRPACGSVLSGLNKAMQNIAGLVAGLQGGAAQPGFSAQASSGSSIQAGAKPGSEVSKLGPNPTFEDLISAFMMDVMKDMQNEMKQKMSEYEKMKGDKGKGAKGASSSKKSGGGFFGKILGGLGKIAGLGGSILGGIVGGPVGSMIGGGLGNALGGLLGQVGGASASSAQGAQGKAGAQGAKGDEDSRQILFEKIKDLMQKMQAMFQSLSNVLNTMHQGSMNSIRNIRA